MTLRAALLLVSTVLLAACVSTGQVDPMKTDKGRDEARDAYIALGIGYLKQGATERAKVPLKKALELDPSNADANAALALVFQTEMEPQLADEHFRKALSARNDSRILNNYGGFLYEQGRYKDAYERFQQAADDTLYPERSRVFESLGLTALKMNDPALAKQHFDKALRLNRDQPLALLEMAQLSYDEKQYVPARDYYDRYTQIAPQNARSLLLGARLSTIFEDRDQAASLGLQLKRLYPGTPEYQHYLSEQ
ncbi:type IV pilus biogenesis/stability protein PilW [Metapseudomonas resinovorans]|uniref:Type 4 pili biogenesis protein PilF n=1 Tax=Metapseudomonas resinovorans NBRC 106553 TaxID=1245471 RepID=S6AG19_METRE|nr:type IV pilus biogenesis/stability protein PilW [Pseudomonas resinovorans]BAN46875.1 type 4 pili biogenesis protein PilF [Pseudomonas resinovorans NBRC 106553]